MLFLANILFSPKGPILNSFKRCHISFFNFLAFPNEMYFNVSAIAVPAVPANLPSSKAVFASSTPATSPTRYIPG